MSPVTLAMTIAIGSTRRTARPCRRPWLPSVFARSRPATRPGCGRVAQRSAWEDRSHSWFDSLLLQEDSEGMGGTRAVRLYTAFRAPHRRRGFRYVQLFPVTQKKSLALTGGQLFKGLSDQIRNL